MSSDELSLIFLADTVVGGGDSYVRFLVSELELVVSVVTLTCDLNALDGNEETLLACESLSLEVCSVLIDLCVVNGSNFLSGSIEDLNGSFDDLVCAVVVISLTLDLNGHTNLEAHFCDGILFNVVNVVAAYFILEIDGVGSGSLGFGNDTVNNTLYDNDVTGLCCNVFVPSVYLVCGNLTCVFSYSCVTFSVCDGSCELISNIGCALFINVDENHTVVLRLDLDSFIVNRPSNCVLNVVNHYCSDNFVVGRCCFSFVFVEVVKIGASLIKTGVFLRSASCEDRNAQYKGENEK